MFEGQTAIVTGAARGIGRAIATELADQGASVAVLDILGNDLDAVAKALTADGLKVTPYPLDLLDKDQICGVRQSILQDLGAPHILVNNAGKTVYGGFNATSPDLLEETFKVNVTLTLMVTQAFLPDMLAQGYGRIINLASGAGLQVVTNLLAYSVSKAALIMLTKQLAVEFGAKGITVNAVAPGPIETEMLKQNQSDAVRGALSDSIPSGQYGQPADVAKAVALLAQPSAGHINGQILGIDGGQAAVMTMLHRLPRA